MDPKHRLEVPRVATNIHNLVEATYPRDISGQSELEPAGEEEGEKEKKEEGGGGKMKNRMKMCRRETSYEGREVRDEEGRG